jgi:hypothetical protein
MNLDDARLAPGSGEEGLACRFPGVIFYAGRRDPEAVVADLVGRCRQAATRSAPGAALARQLAGVLAGAEDDVPPFALVARTADGIAVLINGPLDVQLQGEEGTESLSGASSITWVDRVYTGSFATITVQRTGEEPPSSDATDVDLVQGVVPASGLAVVGRGTSTDTGEVVVGEAPAVVAPAVEVQSPPPVEPPPPPAVEPEPEEDPTEALAAVPEPPPPVEPAAPPVEPAEFDSVLLHGDHIHDHAPVDAETEEREPLPVQPDPAESRTSESQLDEVMVQGVVCSRGHFNDPRSRFCSSCGISMVQQTLNLVPGPRPPLGVLVFEDGSTYSLSSDYVVGRQPDVSPLVQQGRSLPLALEDDERTISRAHAELRLEGWDVQFVNLSSTNGSFVWDPGTSQWVQLQPDQPLVLSSGMRIALGRRTAVFESALVR